MTYEEFINLQIGDVVEISAGDIVCDSCIVIIVNKKLSMQPLKLIEYVYYCKTLYPNRFQELNNSWYDYTSIIIYIDKHNIVDTFVYGYVDVNWQIGYENCRYLSELTIFKGDI